MPIASLTTLAAGARQFVVHDALEMTWCWSGSYLSKLTPRTTVMSSLEAGRADDDLLRARVEVRLRLRGVGEEAGRLDDDVGAEVGPRQRARIALGEHLDRRPVHDQPVVRRLDGARVRSEDRVVLQELCERLGVRQVVDGDPLDVCTGGLGGAEDVAADPAEAVDPHAYGHQGRVLSLASWADNPNSGPLGGLRDVPVGDLDPEVVVRPVAVGEVLGDGDGAVPPAGAAERDGQVRLALRLVLGEQEVQQRDEPVVELARACRRARRSRGRAVSCPVSSRRAGS